MKQGFTRADNPITVCQRQTAAALGVSGSQKRAGGRQTLEG